MIAGRRGKSVDKRYIILWLLFAFVFFLPNSLEAGQNEGDSSFPFKVGEELTYKITWYGILAGIGKIKLENETLYQGKEVYRLVSQGVSAGVIGKFYKVDDRLEVFVDPAGLYPYYAFFYQQEGRRRKTTEVIFNQKENKITYITNNGRPREFTAPPKVLDILSSLYFYRAQDLQENQSVSMKVFNSKKIFMAQAKIIAKEKLQTPWGKVDTYMVKPTVSLNGVNYKKGEAVMWVTADERKIPVKIKIKVAIGHITATLTEYKAPKDNNLHQ
jgi:hypothetical protein